MKKKNTKEGVDAYFSLSLEKGLGILRLFTRDRPAWTLTQIARALGLNKTSAFRFVNTLVQLGYLRKHPETKLISLGAQVLNFVFAFSQTDHLSDVGKPFVDEVFETHDITIDLALFEEDTIAVVYRRESRGILIPRFPIIPTDEKFYCSSLGKAILAYLPQDKMMRIVDRLSFAAKTDKTVIKRTDLLADLERTRKRGYAVNNEEWVKGLIAIGAPIINLHSKEVIGAVCFDFSTVQHSITTIEKKYGKVIVKLARDISNAVSLQI
jgi:DNA-binding IclR family transcriptional regulator